MDSMTITLDFATISLYARPLRPPYPTVDRELQRRTLSDTVHWTGLAMMNR